MSCWAAHSAVGFVVTAKWTGRRRACPRITNTNRSRNAMVGTTKKTRRYQVLRMVAQTRCAKSERAACEAEPCSWRQSPAKSLFRALTVPREGVAHPNEGWPDSFSESDLELRRVRKDDHCDSDFSISSTGGSLSDARRSRFRV